MESQSDRWEGSHPGRAPFRWRPPRPVTAWAAASLFSTNSPTGMLIQAACEGAASRPDPEGGTFLQPAAWGGWSHAQGGSTLTHPLSCCFLGCGAAAPTWTGPLSPSFTSRGPCACTASHSAEKWGRAWALSLERHEGPRWGRAGHAGAEG